MTIAPWAFGIDRASLEEETVSLCELIMVNAIDPSFPRSKISIVDQGAGRPMRPRPCITIKISSPINSPRAGENARNWPTLEQWTIQFTSSVDDTYVLTILGVDYTVIAVGLAIEALRDAMLTELGVDPSWTASAQGTDTIDLISTTKGTQLFVLPTPASIVAKRTVKNYFKRGFIPALLQVNIQCWGLLSIEDPIAVQGGPSIAENMRSAFLDTDLSQRLRYCGFAPITARVLDGADILNQQTNSDATCQVVMRAMSRMDVQISSGTQITTTPTVIVGV